MLNVHGSSGFWILVFMFLKYVFFVFSSLMQFFHFPGQCVASYEVFMSSLLLHSSILLRKRLLQNRICAVVIFCPKKFVTNW